MQDWLGAAQPYYPFYNYYGYTDLGPVSVPPDPPICAMTDRTTGAVYLLCFDPTQGNRLALASIAIVAPLLLTADDGTTTLTADDGSTILTADTGSGQTADALPFGRGRTYIVFGPWDGPFIDSYGLRMGVDNGHVVFEPFPGMDSGAGPYGFQLNSGNTQYAQVGAAPVLSTTTLDHLTYTLSPLSP